MIVERTDKEIIVRIPATIDPGEIQDVLNFIRYKELTAKTKVKQPSVDTLASSINRKWWKKNAKKLLNESGH